MIDLNEIFLRSYLQEYNEKEKKKILHSQEDRVIAAQKKQKLSTIEEFLQKFVDLEIHVQHRDQFTRNTSPLHYIESQKFNFYFVDSSKKWSPGISIFFDHPAEVEIAIPNKIEEEGAVVIKVATHHPDAYILEQKFTNLTSACEALGKFLGKNTVSIGKDPSKYLEEKNQKSKNINHDFLQNVPDEPPHTENGEKKHIDSSISLKKINEIFDFNKNNLQEKEKNK